MHYEVLIAFIASSLILTISPGPDILYVISQSFIKGTKAAIITSLGLTTGLLFHTFFVVVGLSLLIKKNENIFLFLKLIGALYFVFLAIMVFLKRNKKINIKSNQLENIDFFKKGLFMNYLKRWSSLISVAIQRAVASNILNDGGSDISSSLLEIMPSISALHSN